LPLTLLVMGFWGGRLRWSYAVILLGIVLFLVAMSQLFPDTFRSMFLDKFAGKNQSGAMRLEANRHLNDLFASLTLPNWIFGVGFGYCYLGIYQLLLVNTGLIGLGTFLWAFLRPLFLLPTTPGYEGLKGALFAILVASGLSLSELYLPPMWMFLGLAWFKLAEYRQQRPAPATRAYALPAWGNRGVTGRNLP
jgi:hypothetical protein